jgi:hypothetical protein
MSSGSSVQDSPSKKADDALRLFRTIQPNDKLRYSKTRDTFEIDRGGRNFARTFSNVFRAHGTENSVTNDDMFYAPIVLVFRRAKITADIEDLNAAYIGLRNLAVTYRNDATKLASLNKTLEAVKETIDEPPMRLSANSLLRLSVALLKNPELIWSEYARNAGFSLESSIIQQINMGDRASLQVIFGAVRNGKSKINEDLKKIGDSLDTFSGFDAKLGHMPGDRESPEYAIWARKNRANKKSNIDLEGLSNKIYGILQAVEGKDIQHHNLAFSSFNYWIKKIKDKVQAKGLSVYFQVNSGVNFSNASDDLLPAIDFLWFYREPQPRRANISRLYFCPAIMFDIDHFIGVAGDLMRSGQFVFKFKIDFNKELKFDRKDAIVLYFEGDINIGRELAAEFKKRLGPGYLKRNFGVFGSTSVSADNDVFWQAEPGRLDTGLSNKEKEVVFDDKTNNRIARQHSASAIRADLITMALLLWKIDFDYQVAKCKDSELVIPDLSNDGTFEYEFELFQSYVARALDGYKLYLNPGLRS